MIELIDEIKEIEKRGRKSETIADIGIVIALGICFIGYFISIAFLF